MQDEKARNRVARYRDKRRGGYEQKSLWIAKTDSERLERIAKRDGMINEAGRNAGKPSVQMALVEAVRLGLEALEAK